MLTDLCKRSRFLFMFIVNDLKNNFYLMVFHFLFQYALYSEKNLSSLDVEINLKECFNHIVYIRDGIIDNLMI